MVDQLILVAFSNFANFSVNSGNSCFVSLQFFAILISLQFCNVH